MKTKTVLALLVIAGAIGIWFQFQAQQKLRMENNSLQLAVTQLGADNTDLLRQLTAVTNANKLSPDQENELLRLRGEVASLRQKNSQLTKQTQQAQEQIARQQAPKAVAPPGSDDAPPQPDQSIPAKANDARGLVFALLKYAGENQTRFPADLNAVGPFLDSKYTGTNSFELVYHGSRDAISDPSSTIIVRESVAWQRPDGRWAKAYGFADGHAEVHTEASGDFGPWEQQRIIQTIP